LNAATSVSSSNALLTVLRPASIVQQPLNRSVHPNANVSFSVLANGTTPLTYQWRYNGSPIPGATNFTYSLLSVQPDKSGSYSVMVGNSVNSILSANATLLVYTNPLIATQPQTRFGRVGTNATFVVSAVSSTPISYQWRFNGADIAGATSSSYTVNNAQLANDGIYTVRLTDSYGSVVSDPANLVILVNPAITDQPQSQTVALGSTVNFQVQVTANPLPIGYRWRRNGSTFTNLLLYARTHQFTLANVANTHAGLWTVVLTNLANPTPGLLSSNAYLTVVTPPANQVVSPGSTATFNVSAAGVPTNIIFYQW